METVEYLAVVGLFIVQHCSFKLVNWVVATLSKH